MKVDEKTGIARGHLFERIADPCEICGETDEEKISQYAGQACKIMFDKWGITICQDCWAKKYKEVFNEDWE